MKFTNVNYVCPICQAHVPSHTWHSCLPPHNQIGSCPTCGLDKTKVRELVEASKSFRENLEKMPASVEMIYHKSFLESGHRWLKALAALEETVK